MDSTDSMDSMNFMDLMDSSSLPFSIQKGWWLPSPFWRYRRSASLSSSSPILNFKGSLMPYLSCCCMR